MIPDNILMTHRKAQLHFSTETQVFLCNNCEDLTSIFHRFMKE